jgi:nucleotide-binding universal stress UspA family protein
MKIHSLEKTVVVPWDFSEMSSNALNEVLDMVEDRTQIKIVHVTYLPSAYEYGVVWNSVTNDEIVSRVEEEFRKSVRDDERLKNVDFTTMFGDPGTRICDFAAECNAGLIVMSSHGRKGISHLLLGSVAERVVRSAPCPVLVLRETKATNKRKNRSTEKATS